MFVFIIILVIIALAIFITSLFLKKTGTKWLKLGSLGVFAVAAILALLNSFYSQDPGTAVVQRSITGAVVDQTTEQGLHWKAPWVDTIEFSIRNQPVSFITPKAGDKEGAGYKADGPQITVQDKDGVTSNVDINVLYSIQPGSVTGIYNSFKNEDTFKSSYVFQSIRDVVRESANDFTTLQLMTDRSQWRNEIESKLKDRWSDSGVIVSTINLQEFKPPQTVQDAYAAAQKAQISVTTETNNLAAAKIKAQTNVALSASLTPQILQEKLIEAYKAGTVFVVPSSGFNGILNLPSAVK